MGFFVRIYMRVCKKMVIYLGIKTPQSGKERKYKWQKNARISCTRNGCKYTWEKTARIGVYRVIILKQMADHIHDALRKSFLKVIISKTKRLNGTETPTPALGAVYDKRRLQTCRPQTCRPADLQTRSELTGGGG